MRRLAVWSVLALLGLGCDGATQNPYVVTVTSINQGIPLLSDVIHIDSQMNATVPTDVVEIELENRPYSSNVSVDPGVAWYDFTLRGYTVHWRRIGGAGQGTGVAAPPDRRGLACDPPWCRDRRAGTCRARSTLDRTAPRRRARGRRRRGDRARAADLVVDGPVVDRGGAGGLRVAGDHVRHAFHPQRMRHPAGRIGREIHE